MQGGSQQHISLITVMVCFNEFAFAVQVKHRISSTQILGFILICLYFYLRLAISTHVGILCKECSYFPFNSWLSFQRLSSFMGILFMHRKRLSYVYVYILIRDMYSKHVLSLVVLSSTPLNDLLMASPETRASSRAGDSHCFYP